MVKEGLPRRVTLGLRLERGRSEPSEHLREGEPGRGRAKALRQAWAGVANFQNRSIMGIDS